MIKMEYNQEKPQAIIYIVPGVFVIFSVIMIVTGFKELGLTKEFLLSSLMPAIGVVIFVACCFKILVKQNRRTKDAFAKIRAEGQRLEGTIRGVNEYQYHTHDADGDIQTRYYYTFNVEYYDPDTAEMVTQESIRVDRHYEPVTGRCRFLLLGEELLVEEADVAYVKTKWSALDFVLVFGFLTVVIAMILWTVVPILKTL